MREKALTILNALGVTGAGDDPLFDFIVGTVTQALLNLTNQSSLPEGLINMAAYRVAGQYLAVLKGSGKLDLTSVDLDAAVKQIQEGDTNVSFAIGAGSSTPEQRLDGLISAMISCGEREINRFRKLVW